MYTKSKNRGPRNHLIATFFSWIIYIFAYFVCLLVLCIVHATVLMVNKDEHLQNLGL